MAGLNLRGVLIALALVWALGFFLFPLGGAIHFLLIIGLIVWIVDRVGRAP